MAQPFCTGPCHVYVGVGVGGIVNSGGYTPFTEPGGGYTPFPSSGGGYSQVPAGGGGGYGNKPAGVGQSGAAVLPLRTDAGDIGFTASPGESKGGIGSGTGFAKGPSGSDGAGSLKDGPPTSNTPAADGERNDVDATATRQRYAGGYTNFDSPLPQEKRSHPQILKKPVYFGTCEESPAIDFIPFRRKIKTDFSVDEADDVQFTGEEALVFGLFNVYSELVYQLLQARPSFVSNVRGINGSYDRGTLMRRAGLTYPIWLYFPYAAKPAMGDMPGGYRFLECYIEKDSMPRMGTRPKNLFLAWHAIRRHEVGVLYDHNLSELPAPFSNR